MGSINKPLNASLRLPIRTRSLVLHWRSKCWQRPCALRCEATIATPETRNAAGATLIGAAKAHDASFTAALVLSDAQGAKQIITASSDKSVALWTVNESGLRGEKFTPPGGPIFSFVQDPAAANPLLLDQSVNRGVFCGSAAKSVVAWNPPNSYLDEKINLNGHTGWVRAITSFERWLFSCGCNQMKQWDASWPIPKEVASTSLFTGDILGIAAGGGKVFTCGADGSIRSWNISKAGALSEGAVREKAHEGRVSAIAWHKNFLYSVSYDGSIKGWSSDSLDLVLEVKGAHNKERIHCLAVGADGALYTGGEDKLVRTWLPAVLEPMGPPLEFHGAGVRALAAGPLEVLVSGDANGDMAVWTLAPPPPAAPAAAAAVNGVAFEPNCNGMTLPDGYDGTGGMESSGGAGAEELVAVAAAEAGSLRAVANGSSGGEGAAVGLPGAVDAGSSSNGIAGSSHDDFLQELAVCEAPADDACDVDPALEQALDAVPEEAAGSDGAVAVGTGDVLEGDVVVAVAVAAGGNGDVAVAAGSDGDAAVAASSEGDVAVASEGDGDMAVAAGSDGDVVMAAGSYGNCGVVMAAGSNGNGVHAIAGDAAAGSSSEGEHAAAAAATAAAAAVAVASPGSNGVHAAELDVGGASSAPQEGSQPGGGDVDGDGFDMSADSDAPKDSNSCWEDEL